MAFFILTRFVLVKYSRAFVERPSQGTSSLASRLTTVSLDIYIFRIGLNNMAAGVLTYELGLLSYTNSKLEKWKNFKKIVKPSSCQVYSERVFCARQRMVPLSAGTNAK